MRKIIVGARVSMDGLMQAPSGPVEDADKGFKFGGWSRPYQDQDCAEEFDRLFLGEKFDLLLGRKTYEIFARYWPVPGLGGRSRWRHPEGLQRDQEVRGFTVGRGRHELAGLAAPARHRRRK